jgi:hypothetical protein
MTDHEWLMNSFNDCELLNAWFSEKAAQWFGSVLYLTPDGRKIEVTQVSSGMEYGWDDKVYLGKVVHYNCGGFLGKGRWAPLHGSQPFLNGKNSV